MSVNEKMTAIADAIRTKTGGTDSLTLDGMAEAINGLEIGVELPTLTNEGSASDLLSGKELIDGEGNIIRGNIATKTASDLTASGATIIVPAGYYPTQAVKSIETATQATPSIGIDDNGLITASATQTAGYVTAGTKSSTHQLAFQPAKTITPSTSSQIAVSSGYYTGGDITVDAIPSDYIKPVSTKGSTTYTPTTTSQTIAGGTYLTGTQIIEGDSNLIAENIKSGVSIFGVNGTLEEGSGSSGEELVDYSENEDAIITRTLSNYTNDRVMSIGNYIFAICSNLTTVSFPACTSIGNYAFVQCTNLTTVSFPSCISISTSAFAICTNLTTVSFPSCITIGEGAFFSCTSLTSVSFPSCITIGEGAFDYCTRLTSVSFPACTSIGSYAFSRCTRLTSVSFPACISIGIRAFISCSRLTSVSFPACTSIANSAFFSCTSLTSVSFPACTSIGGSAFYRCTSLTSVSFPVCTSIGSYAFYICSSLTSVSFPACTSIGSYAFFSCTSLTSVSFPACTSIANSAFCSCTKLTSIYLTNSSVCTLKNSNAFSSTGIGSNKGYIYVPSSLVASYQTATNWTYFSSIFVGI